jgi:hypothetical protein
MRLDTYVSKGGTAENATTVNAAKIIDVDIPRETITILRADNTTEVVHGLAKEDFFSPPNNPNVGDYFMLEGELALFMLKEGFEGSMTLKEPTPAGTDTKTTTTD